MVNEKTLVWIQIVTGLTVVVGLGLVIWELDLSRRIAVAQVTGDSFSLTAQTNAATFGEDAADVLAKACEAPKELTPGEWVVLNGYYLNRLAVAESLRYIENLGFGDQGAWRRIQTMVLTDMFSTAPGRAWFVTKYRRTGADTTVRIGDELLKEAGPVSCVIDFQSYQKETVNVLELSID